MTNPLAELQTTVDQAVRAAGDRFVAQPAAKDQELAAQRSGASSATVSTCAVIG
jgi:hypothetical protein